METPAVVGKTVIIYRNKHEYNAWPSITILDNGEWLVGWDSTRLSWEVIFTLDQRSPISHPPEPVIGSGWGVGRALLPVCRPFGAPDVTFENYCYYINLMREVAGEAIVLIKELAHAVLRW